MKSLFFIVCVLAVTVNIYAQTTQPAQQVMPSATDPSIDSFDTPHNAYFTPSVKSKNELVVFLPGTGGSGRGGVLFSQTASELGFHVVSLSYPSSIPAAICQSETDENCFENFRLEIITGQDKSALIEVSRANSIENRLHKLLMYLREKNGREGWGNYLTDKNEIKWEKLVLAGMSQGGGHAPLMAKYHRVSRVVMFGAPKDYDAKNNRPAKWYGNGKTPLDRFFAFNHKQDRQGCDFPQQLEILRTFGLYKFGEPVDVDSVVSPYNYSHILITNFPGREVSSAEAHTSVFSDPVTPKDEIGLPLFQPVWTYMLTAK